MLNLQTLIPFQTWQPTVNSGPGSQSIRPHGASSGTTRSGTTPKRRPFFIVTEKESVFNSSWSRRKVRYHCVYLCSVLGAYRNDRLQVQSQVAKSTRWPDCFAFVCFLGEYCWPLVYCWWCKMLAALLVPHEESWLKIRDVFFLALLFTPFKLRSLLYGALRVPAFVILPSFSPSTIPLLATLPRCVAWCLLLWCECSVSWVIGGTMYLWWFVLLPSSVCETIYIESWNRK